MSLEDAIQKQIEEYEFKAENDVKTAKSIEHDAEVLAQNGTRAPSAWLFSFW